MDRSDKKAERCLIDPRSGERRAVVIDTAPEALWEWLAQLHQQHPQARVGLCLEQLAVHLIAFLETYEWITLHLNGSRVGELTRFLDRDAGSDRLPGKLVEAPDRRDGGSDRLD